MVCVTFRTDSYCSDSTRYDYRNAVETQDPVYGLKTLEFDCNTKNNCKRSFAYGGLKTKRNEGWCSNTKNTTSEWTKIKVCNMQNKCTELKVNNKIKFGSNVCSDNSTDEFLKLVKNGHGPLDAQPTIITKFTYTG